MPRSCDRRVSLIPLVATIVALAGCGASGPTSEQRLDIEAQVGHAEFAANAFCLGISEGGAGGPTGGEAVAILTRLHRAWPDDKKIRQETQDIAATLDDQCGDDGARYARRLDRELKRS